MNGTNDFEERFSHRQAFKWLQMERDGDLDEAGRLRLSSHLKTCHQCRLDVSFQQSLPGLLVGNVSGKRIVKAEAGGMRMAQAALRARKRELRWRQPLQTIAWMTMALLLVLFIGWGIERLKPGSVGPVSTTAPLVLSQPPANPMVNAPVQSISPALPNDAGLFLALVGFFLALGALSLVLRRSPARWLYTLLVGLAGSIALLIFFSTSRNYGGSEYVLFLFLPLAILFLAVFLTYLWFHRRQWSVATWLATLAAIAGTCILLTSQWARSSLRIDVDWRVLLFIIVLAAVPVAIWQLFGLIGRWRWLAALIFGIWILWAMLFALQTYAINVRLPDLLFFPTNLIAMFYPTFATIAAGWLLYTALAPQTVKRKDFLLRLGAILLVFASLFILLRTMVVDSSKNWESYSGQILLFFMLLGGVIAGAALIWKLPRQRVFPGLALLAIFIAGILPAISIKPDEAAVVTTQRAATIDLAISRYYQEKGAYPPNLEALSPGYLLLVPRPVVSLTNDWCYVSGGDYFRLGYPVGNRFDPRSMALQEFTGGNLPAGTSQCERELQKWKAKTY